MNIQKYTAESRGFANHGWLMANHSFSFANYYNPERMSFGKLRVLNDDIIAPSMGFGKHPHQNMEIVTIPLSGKLKHKDSLADAWLEVLPNEVQVMSAGTGVYHSEMNASTTEHLSLFQIWIEPDTQNVTPRYDQKTFDKAGRDNQLQVLVSGFNSNEAESLKINQDAKISRLTLSENNSFNYPLLSKTHGVYVMVIDGNIDINGTSVESRDALGVSETEVFTIKANNTSEVLFIEVPMV